MTDRTPDFSELIGEDLPAEERARLESAHQMMVTAGPLPELPLSLQKPPVVDDRHDASAAFQFLPRKGGRIMTLAAGFALLAPDHRLRDRQPPQRLHDGLHRHDEGNGGGAGSSGRPQRRSDRLGRNWPLELKVSGLKQLPDGSWYTLYLTKKRKPVESCGTFRVQAGTTTVRMNAPYHFSDYDGWVVTATTKSGKPGPALLAEFEYLGSRSLVRHERRVRDRHVLLEEGLGGRRVLPDLELRVVVIPQRAEMHETARIAAPEVLGVHRKRWPMRATSFATPCSSIRSYASNARVAFPSISSRAASRVAASTGSKLYAPACRSGSARCRARRTRAPFSSNAHSTRCSCARRGGGGVRERRTAAP